MSQNGLVWSNNWKMKKKTYDAKKNLFELFLYTINLANEILSPSTIFILTSTWIFNTHWNGKINFENHCKSKSFLLTGYDLTGPFMYWKAGTTRAYRRMCVFLFILFVSFYKILKIFRSKFVLTVVSLRKPVLIYFMIWWRISKLGTKSASTRKA